MKSISANFKIIDNCGFEYESSITINNPFTSNVNNELKERLAKIYRIKTDQVLSLSNIVTTF